MDAPVLTRRWRKLLGNAVTEPDLGEKPKLGGVRALLPFSLYFPFCSLWSFRSFFPFFFVLLFCKNDKKISLFFFFRLTFEKSKNIFFSLFSLLCCRVQLKPVMIIFSYVRSCKWQGSNDEDRRKGCNKESRYELFLFLLLYICLYLWLETSL